uniref:(California timema) hypothetical protein n=1 Tax=Timema californicum TaxID=61474 RepID=A0A7R9J5L2_TIMCA|nr:unnamed protein product [Timema californicum]
MCDVRKGTSTRKPRLNPQLVAQVAQIFPAPLKTIKKDIIAKDVSSKESSGKVRTEKKRQSTEGKSVNKKWRPPRLKNVDRSNAETHAIAVNNVTVLITEYKPKVKKTVSDTSGRSSSASSDNGSQSESSTDARGDF